MYEFLDYVDAMPFAEFIGIAAIFLGLAFFAVHVLFFVFLVVRSKCK